MDCVDHGYRGNKRGYRSVKYEGVLTGAHRAAYCIHHGVPLASIQDSVVRHDCDNPRCINPAHLRLGTQKDNIQDMMVRGRHKHQVYQGEAHPNSKLSATVVSAIRDEYKQGGVRQADLASKYGISKSQVGNITRGEQWQ